MPPANPPGSHAGPLMPGLQRHEIPWLADAVGSPFGSPGGSPWGCPGTASIAFSDRQVTPAGIKKTCRAYWFYKQAIPDGVFPTSIERFENVSLIVLDFVMVKKSRVFVTKASLGMVTFLIADIIDDPGKLREWP